VKDVQEGIFYLSRSMQQQKVWLTIAGLQALLQNRVREITLWAHYLL
jgi:hypothetical protein